MLHTGDVQNLEQQKLQAICLLAAMAADSETDMRVLLRCWALLQGGDCIALLMPFGHAALWQRAKHATATAAGYQHHVCQQQWLWTVRVTAGLC